MDIKTCFVVCSILLIFLFGCKLAIGDELNESSCMEVRYEKNRMVVLTNQACLMRFYATEFAKIQDGKPKSTLCKVVKPYSYMHLNFIITGWFVESAECLDQPEGLEHN